MLTLAPLGVEKKRISWKYNFVAFFSAALLVSLVCFIYFANSREFAGFESFAIEDDLQKINGYVPYPELGWGINEVSSNFKHCNLNKKQYVLHVSS